MKEYTIDEAMKAVVNIMFELEAMAAEKKLELERRYVPEVLADTERDIDPQEKRGEHKGDER